MDTSPDQPQLPDLRRVWTVQELARQTGRTTRSVQLWVKRTHAGLPEAVRHWFARSTEGGWLIAADHLLVVRYIEHRKVAESDVEFASESEQE